MRHLSLACCLIAAACGPASAAAASGRDDAADVRAILQAEREVCAAFERADADWLEQHLDPTFTLTASTGKVTSAAQEAADLRGGTRYTVFRNRGTRVRLYGDAAVTTGITRVEGRSDGEAYALDFQFTDTWVRRPRGWTLVASHASRLAAPAP